MTTLRYEKLENQVASALEQYDLETFDRAWQLGKDIAGDVPILGFYFTAESGYENVALITHELLIDVEGEDEAGEEGPTSHLVMCKDSVR